MAKIPYMRWYPADYAGDTTHLTRDQDGGYRLLLDSMWLRDGKLPDDDAQLAVITKCSTLDEWHLLRKILAPFFKISHGIWRQKRLTRELREMYDLQQVRRNAGKKGAVQRWQTHTFANGKTMALPTPPTPSLLLPPKPPNNNPSLPPPYPDSPPPTAARAPNGRAASPDKDLESEGGALLGERKRGLIRKMVVRYGPEVVRGALAAVARRQPAEPIPYFLSCCEEHRPGPDPPAAAESNPGPQGPPPKVYVPLEG